MPNEQISDFTALAVAPAAGDLLAIVDVSDTTDAPTGTTKKIAVSNLVLGGAPAAHATSHQNGGSDEVNVGGLSGVLADPQTPITEVVQDIVGAMFADSATIDFTYDDGAGTVTANALGAAPSGAAGGDLAGTYPNPSVVKTSLTGAHGSDDTWTGTTIAGLNAGATIAQWEAVYLGGSSTWLLADANGSGTYPARGLAVAAYVNTDPAIILVHGTVRNDAWAWTPGGTIYLSATAGGLTQTAPSTSGDQVQQVGFALTADIAFFDFNSNYLTVT